jgi:acetyl esterase
VALQVLVCPALDGGRAARVGERRAKRDLLDLGTVQRFWADWTAGADPSDAEGASPLQAGDLSGAPAALVLTAGRDPLAAGGRAFVERLKDAGVPVLDDDFPDDFHDFLNLLMMRSSETGFQRIIRAVRAVIVKGRL